jgi:putative membrane protein
MTRWLLAAFHLMALGIGLGAVVARAYALQGPMDSSGIRRVLTADNWWGVAALLWLVTGLMRLLGGAEKPTTYYLSNHLFWTKMGLFAFILLLELSPMILFIRWRTTLARGGSPDTRSARRFAGVSWIEAGLVALMVFVATALARGYGAGAGA